MGRRSLRVRSVGGAVVSGFGHGWVFVEVVDVAVAR